MPKDPRNPFGFFDVVRELARALPDVEENSGRGAPSVKVRGKLLTCPALHKSAEPNSLVVKIGLDQRAELIAGDPDVYYVTDHYVDYPSVLVRMSRIDRESLKDLLFSAWRFVTRESEIKKKGIRKRGASRRTLR
jgi:hypothetical protein